MPCICMPGQRSEAVIMLRQLAVPVEKPPRLSAPNFLLVGSLELKQGDGIGASLSK